MNPYVELANAIVICAANDYRKALKAYNRNPNNKFAKSEMEDCERFFRSAWYKTLTDVDGELLIRKLRQEASL